MKLSLGFGLRLRGLDLLTSLRVGHDGSRDGDAEELQLEDVAPWPRGGSKGTRWCPSDGMAIKTSYKYF